MGHESQHMFRKGPEAAAAASHGLCQRDSQSF